MQYRPLGRTGLTVSHFCLGTMTFGTQTPEADAHTQLDMALEAGINFLDTAEMYPTNPVRAEAVGETEAIIGRWRARQPRAADMLLATKVTGEGQTAVRDGAPVTGAIIRSAVENSLRRLQADHIHLYQLHWPNRGSYHFRKYWHFDPYDQPRGQMQDHVGDVLDTMGALVAEGKVGALGLSNESAWGVMQFMRGAEVGGGLRVAAIQNEFNLLNRLFDLDLAEIAHHEDVGLLAFSPLAAGILSGKYAGDVTPPGTRRTHTPDLGGRLTPTALAATDAYCAIASRHGLDPVHMALAYCAGRRFMTSVIIGATTRAQLAHILSGADLTLSDAVLADIATVYRQYPRPM